MTTSAHITATFPQGTLTLYLGEQQLGDENHPFVAHLSWKADDFELQGPILVSASSSAEAIKFTIASCVYRLQPVQIMTTSSSDCDVAMPLDNRQILVVDLAGVEEREKKIASENVESFFASLRLTNSGLDLRLVPDVDIPFDLCLDSEVAAPLPSALPDVVQLVHRQVLGSRFRHHKPVLDNQLLRATSTGTPPALTLLWALAPILQDGDRYRMLVNMIFVKSSEPSSVFPADMKLQTENLLLLSRDNTDSDELGAMVGLLNITAKTEERFLLNETAIAERIEGIQATGIIVQRIMHGGDAATFRVVPRNISLTASGGGSSEIRSTLVASASSIDFRIVTPSEASRICRRYKARYLLDEPPADPVLDRDRLAWRRFGIADVQWDDKPSREAATSQFGFLWCDRTAFHRMPLLASAPPPQQIFPVDANLAKSFRPRAIEIQLAPDKPGAMFHHAIQAIESESATLALTETALPRPPGLITEPVTDFALREPMQLTPPPGADLVIEKATRTLIEHRQAERIQLQWKETLGYIKLNLLQTTVLLDQINFNRNDKASWPKAKKVDVALTDKPFLQTIVRINDELLDIDALQPQFPLYDARQSAATKGELDDRTKAFKEKETDNTSDRRPLTPMMGRPVTQLSVRASSQGLWVLATANSNLRFWRLDDPRQLPFYRTTSNDTLPFLAEFATIQGQQTLLCNHDGNKYGLFLRDLSDESPNQDKLKELSTAPVHAIRFVAFASAHPVDASGDDYQQIVIEACVALEDDQIQVWYHLSSSNQTDLQGPINIPLSIPSAADWQFDVSTVVHAHSAAPKLDHHILSIAVGGGKDQLGQDKILTYQIDFSAVSVQPYHPPERVSLEFFNHFRGQRQQFINTAIGPSR